MAPAYYVAGIKIRKKIAYVTSMNLERILTKYNRKIITEDETNEEEMKQNFTEFVLEFEKELARERIHILESQLEKIGQPTEEVVDETNSLSNGDNGDNGKQA